MENKELQNSLTEAQQTSANNNEPITPVESGSDTSLSAADALLQRLSQKGQAVQQSSPVVSASVEAPSARIEVNLETPDELAILSEELHDGSEEHTDDLEHESASENSAALSIYNDLSKAQLVETLDELLKQKQVQEIKGDVENIKSQFYKKHKAEVAERKKKFLENGGIEEDFKVDTDPVEAKLKELYGKYREMRNQLSEKLEKEKQDNLKAKYQIIEEFKILASKNENLDKTFNEFKELQKRWRDIGLVPQTEVKGLWESYHYHVEKFYEFVNINKELRDLDYKRNLETKLDLCGRSEELLLEIDIVKAFKELQKLHDVWRETGPVPVEKKDEVWERFKLITTQINKKYQDHFEARKSEQENNL